jgi:hypothetical protein
MSAESAAPTCTTSIAASRGRRAPRARRRGLVDDARLAAQTGRQPPQRFLLQHDEAVGELERAARRGGRGQVAIQVGSGEHDGERPARVLGSIARHRRVAALRVQREQQVAGRAVPGERHRHAVAGAPQERGPAQRRVAVAVTRSGARRRDESDARHGLRLD